MGPFRWPVYPGIMDDEAVEAAFMRWLDQFKAGLPDGMMLGVFLSKDHLREAFRAGLLAAGAARVS